MVCQGCVDLRNKKLICPSELANKCARRESAKTAPRGVTLICSPYNKETKSCEYFIEKGEK